MKQKIRVNVKHPETGKRVTAVTTGKGKGFDSEVKTADGKTTTIREGNGKMIWKNEKK
jgi:hypothetical protein